MARRIEVFINDDSLSEQVESLLRQYPAEPLQEEQNRLLERLQSQLDTWLDTDLDYCLALFGSSANGLGLSNDFDVTAICESEIDREKSADMVRRAGFGFKASADYSRVEIVTRARTPVVKFNDSVTGLPVDLTFTNGLAVRNSQLIKTYLKLQPSLRAVLLALKLWKLGHGFDKPTTYTLALMTIHYMQQHWGLPCLQQRSVSASSANQKLVSRYDYRQVTQPGECQIGKWDCFYATPGAQQEKDAGAVLRGLFKFYADFDWTMDYVDIHRTPITQRYYQPFIRSDFRYRIQDRPGKMKMRSHMCVQDPFDLEHNTAQAMHDNDFDLFKRRWDKGADAVCQGDLEDLLLTTPCKNIVIV